MIERIKSKMAEIVEVILAKPADEFTKNDFDILVSEYGRMKMEIDSAEHNKKMTEMLATMWAK